MHRTVRQLLCLMLLLGSALECADKAVTYTFSGGRFGDNLLAYMHAKWISYLHNIPLLYKPFPYSNELVLDDLEHPYNKLALKKFRQTITLGYQLEVEKHDPLSTLYVLPYFGEGVHDRPLNPSWPYVKVDWEDKNYRTLLKKLITPKNPFPKWELPSNCITVAVHVRRGGGYDSPNAHLIIPLQFAPNHYYIDQIKHISELFNGRLLYLYIFTDDRNPMEIIKEFQKELIGLNIEFDCRKTENNHHSNILEDFFAMMQFDCLIRPESNFSIVASKIADFKVVINPIEFKFENGNPIITKVHTQINGLP